MYEAFYGLNEKPFTLLPDPAFLFLGKKHSMALAMLEYGVKSRAGLTVITGEIGSGKTTLVRRLLNELDDDIAVGLISNTHRSFGELLQWVLLAFGLDYKNKDKVELYQTFVEFMIAEFAKGRRTVLIVDEAQNMDATALEELRVISNINADKNQVLQLILVGQPQLRKTLRRPDMEQFVQRISSDYHLEPFSPEETEQYIDHRLKVAGGRPDLFESFAKRFIHYQTGGVPRLINTLCDRTLVYAFAEQKKQVDIELVHEVVNDRSRWGLFGPAPKRKPARASSVGPSSPWYEDLPPDQRKRFDESVKGAGKDPLDKTYGSKKLLDR